MLRDGAQNQHELHPRELIADAAPWATAEGKIRERRKCRLEFRRPPFRNEALGLHVVAPVALDDALTVNEDTNLTVYPPGILANDTDADGHALTAYYASGPTHGTLTLYVNGSFTYTPSAGYFGTDNFTYRASDAQATGNLATVTLTVTGPTPPVANPNTYQTFKNTPLTIAGPASWSTTPTPRATR